MPAVRVGDEAALPDADPARLSAARRVSAETKAAGGGPRGIGPVVLRLLRRKATQWLL